MLRLESETGWWLVTHVDHAHLAGAFAEQWGNDLFLAPEPRARVLRRTCRELNAPRYEAAAALEQAALTELRERRPDRPIETNVEFWAAVILDFADVPPHMMPAMFSCARTAGWCAHIIEQKKTGRLVRPSARYIGPDPRKPSDVDGAWKSASILMDPWAGQTVHLRFQAVDGGPNTLVEVEVDDVRVTQPS